MDFSIADLPFWRIGALTGSLIPGLLIVIMLLRAGERHFSPKLLLIAAASGVLIAILPLMFSLLEPEARNQLDGLRFFLIRAFVFAGLSEEGAKLIACWFIVRLSVERRSRADLVLGCAGVGLGFAMIENVSYVLHASNEWKSVAFIRAVSAVPMHGFLGLVMGAGLARAEAAHGARRGATIMGVLLACAMLHGLYDLPMFLGELLPMTLPPIEALSTWLSVTTPTLLAATHFIAVAATALLGLGALAFCRRDRSILQTAPIVRLQPPLLDALCLSRITGVLLGGALLLLALAAIGVAIVADLAGSIRSFPIFTAGFGVFIAALGWGVGGADVAALPCEAPGWKGAFSEFALRRRAAAVALVVAAVAVASGAAYVSYFGLRYAVAVVLVMSGSALTGVGALDRALANLDAALGYTPDLLYAFQARGNVYRVMQDYDRALADLDRAVALHPDDADAHGARALIYVARHDYARALPEFDRAVTLEPDNPQILSARAGARLEAGDAEGARRDTDRALQLKPDLSIGYELRARLLTEQDDVTGAIAAYDEAINVEPKNAEAHFARGRLHFENQNFAAASEDFWRAAATGANRSYAMLWLYLARGHLGQDGAPELEGFSHATAQKAWPYPLAELYLGATTLASAASRAMTVDQQCELSFYFGELRLLSGYRSEALRYLSRARDICPHDFVETRTARKDTARLETAGGGASVPSPVDAPSPVFAPPAKKFTPGTPSKPPARASSRR